MSKNKWKKLVDLGIELLKVISKYLSNASAIIFGPKK